MDHSIVIFDGFCNFCSRAVLFIIKRDPKASFRFTASQEPAGKLLLEQHNIAEMASRSLVLIEGGVVYQRSTAALKIARKLSGLWPLLNGLLVVPRPVRDFFYNMIARYRYKVYGKRDDCFIPDAGMRYRFLSAD